MEIDAVWAAASIRGARTARSVVNRLAESEGELKLTFVASDRAQVLADYLLGSCVERDSKRWEVGWRGTPEAGEVLDVIGWNAAGGKRKFAKDSNDDSDNEDDDGGREGDKDDMSDKDVLGAEYYEDQNADGWERESVERDLDRTMTKAAKAYDKWLDLWLKNPEKAARR